MRKRYLLISIVFLLLIGNSNPVLSAVARAESLTPIIMISELQTGGITADGAEDGRQEFIELYNSTDITQDVSGWRVEYLSASHTGSGTPTRTIATLAGDIASQGYLLMSYAAMADSDLLFGSGMAASGLLAKSGGHIRLVDAQGTVIDLVGWGSGVAIDDWWHAPEIPAGQSIQRILPGDPSFTNGHTYVIPSSEITPKGSQSEESPPPEPTCQNIVLSEIFPNPTGADAGHEFIEVHNTSQEAVFLKDCMLRLGDEGSLFAMPNEQLPPLSYRAFYDTETDITLPNATAQTIWLIGADNEEGVQYTDAMKDDTSWASIDGEWQETNVVTPNQANSKSRQANAAPVPTADNAAFCPDGKERNPETNRCRNVLPASETTSCKPGQERNPATNRCRAVKQEGTTPASCQPGQTRNPDTNRCRSVLSAASTQKSCAAGQERNPNTNRCRKVAPQVSELATVEDVATPRSTTSTRWLIIAIVAAGVAGYAVYEWRRDIANILYKYKTYAKKPPP